MEPYLHTLSPFAIRFSEDFGLRWYGLSYLAGFLAGLLVIRWFVRRHKSPLPVEMAGDLVFSIALGTIVGGRLGYCLFYNPALFTEFTSAPPFWGVLAVNQGGMASHGGIVGIIAACWLFGRRHKIPLLHLMDLATFGGAIGIFFGRLANFVNGELVGRVAPASAEWTVRFPQDILSWPRYAPQRLDTLASITPHFGLPADQWNMMVSQSPFSPEARTVIENTLHRILTAVQGGNNTVQELLAPLLDPRYPSQLYQALLEGGAVAVILLLVALKRRPHGVFASLFLILYSVMRIIGEQYRMPDLQLGFQWLGLTRGQWLSFGTIAIGVACLIAVSWKQMPTAKKE